MTPQIYVTRPLPGTALTLLKNFGDVDVNPHEASLTKTELIRKLQGKTAVITLLTDIIDKEVLDACPSLKVISNYAVGFNNIDVKEAKARGIIVCTTPGILTDSTADLTFALILAVTRHLLAADHFTRTGQFQGFSPTLFLGSSLAGKTLGIVGMGRIGEAVAKRALAFNMKIDYYNRSPKDYPEYQSRSLEYLLRESDIVSLHMAYTPELTHLIGEKQLAIMKCQAYLINTARGPLIDERALVRALESKRIKGAGLDVFEEEPRLTPGLSALANVVLLPHIGSATVETREQMAMLAVENLIAALEGRQPTAAA